MNKAIFVAITLGAVLLMTSVASAAPPVTRQVKQNARINQGVKSGQLTRGETVRLRAQQVRIQNTKRRFKADGRFTPRERRKVNRMQNRANKNIYRLKHNRRTRR